MKKIFTLFALAAMTLGAQALELTAADGNVANGYAPIYGLWVDSEGTMSQIIYPEDMLSEMDGGKISQVKFYTSEGIKFANATIQLALMPIEENGFTSVTAFEGATPVATATPVKGDMEMVFDLTEPYAYNGGNLLVECKVITAGTWGGTMFLGTNAVDILPCYYKSYNGAIQAFMPKVTFTYTADATAIESVNADKTVTGVRYYNLAGQEMRQPTGMTIVVTSYADGSTSSVKMMK